MYDENDKYSDGFDEEEFETISEKDASEVKGSPSLEKSESKYGSEKGDTIVE